MFLKYLLLYSFHLNLKNPLFFFNFRHNFSFTKHCTSRFLRFVPSLAIMIAFFMSTWPKMLTNGPQTFEFKEELEDCKKNWLRSLLLVGNFNGIFVSFYISHSCYLRIFIFIFSFSVLDIHGTHQPTSNFSSYHLQLFMGYSNLRGSF